MITLLNVKTDKKIKERAQKIAKKMGLSLSDIINIQLRDFVRQQRISVDLREEIPNKTTIKALKSAEAEYKRGDTSPAFDNAKDAIKWLKSSK